MTSTAVLYQAAAYCLGYPDDEFRERLPLLRAAAPELHGFLDHAASEDPSDLAAHYVQVFDFKNRHSLYLSWWRDGDTRRRGMSLVRFKETYRAHGLEFTGEELPDFLPVVLEFSAHAGPVLLKEHRGGLELLRLALTDFGTPYARVLDAVCATLPGPSPKDRAQALALARSGPPREEVGLEPFGLIREPPIEEPPVGELGEPLIGERS
ncbi:nitrate reductase molybdenum cofactor assembly chaperone [Streptomyces sp. PSKA54]|uniref:Nitrate reductase molybdenum cofactor assembly chaperone n=1 Tax=Streptomyces himalayensis subsp. aureolus TaxID=2758039 RepID=A0A7W2CZA9_9ACTN|nr:nitrate reductase molybdenum cofactor assembly chaperone [Streptomyces himalayensis]MBA4861889.1 nitrate reductase molybdenum cofactor assembly chaperone [Streptomyces himalayensis subsp. aureolus]